MVVDPSAGTPPYSSEESFALALDAGDPLARYRERFHIPADPAGRPTIYFCGNSLGLEPRGARELVERELGAWARLAVDAHFGATTPWYHYHEVFRETGARLVGARPGEVVMMNALTVNLHLMLVSFYRPTRERHRILVESPCFPSDNYAVRSQLRFHGHDPAEALVVVAPRAGEDRVRMEDLEGMLDRHGREIALVFLGGVNFLTGQALDMARITAAARRQGCVVGFDLAHAAGNLPLRLHDWGVDFAVWCSYKYLNGGPGAVGGCFVHERHARQDDLPRFAGWWGNDPATRFRMQLEPEFIPREGADGWQLSNPPILAMAPLRAALAMFDEVGLEALRAKSVRLTGYLEYLLDRLPPGRVEVVTPRDPAERGCQLSLRLPGGGAGEVCDRLRAEGILGDYREPDVIRVAPVPLYNTYHEVWRLALILAGER